MTQETGTNEQEVVAGDTKDDGMVELHQASIEDIDAALNSAQEAEAQGVTEEDSPVQEQSAPLTQPTGQSEPAAQSAKPEVAPQGAEPAKPRTYTEEEIQGIIADNERLKKEGNQKELFIQNRNNELGLVRKQFADTKRQLQEARSALEKGLEEKFQDNPVQALKDQRRIEELDTQIDSIDGQSNRAESIVEAQTFFLRHVDTEKVSIDDVAAVLKSDGIDERYIAQFKANPWEFTTPEALVQFGKRAMDRKEFVTADNDRRLLAKHVLTLNERIKQLEGRPNQVVQNLKRNLNQSPAVTSASSASNKTTREVDPTRMSVAELDAALEQAGLQ